MPFGGLSMFGAGLQLQQVTPGVASTGNFRISGTGIAASFQTEDALGGAGRLVYGKGAAVGTANNVVCIGTGAVIVSNGNSGMTVVGNFSSIQGAGTTNCSVFGSSSNLFGGAGTASVDVVGTGMTINANGFIRCFFAGGGLNATLSGGTGNTVGISPNGSITGNRHTVVGSNASVGGVGNVVIGEGNTVPNPRTGCVVIGNAQTPTRDGQILINGQDFTTAGGSTRAVADVNAVATTQDGCIQYSSITAARTVALVAANSVPIGYRLLVVDFSGSASGVNTITMNRAGADTINAGTTAVINSAFGGKELMSDGVSKWVIVRSF